jgi:hypothetical protein
MSKSNDFEHELLQLVFNNTDLGLLGDTGGLRGSVTPGSLYVSLHTADPGEAGTQATNEVAYSGYARVATARSPVGWTVIGPAAGNAGEVAFPACTAGAAVATHVAVGVAVSGAGVLLYSGELIAPLAISEGITPVFGVGQLEVSEG